MSLFDVLQMSGQTKEQAEREREEKTGERWGSTKRVSEERRET